MVPGFSRCWFLGTLSVYPRGYQGYRERVPVSWAVEFLAGSYLLSPSPSPSRRRGRPRGSKNKPKPIITNEKPIEIVEVSSIEAWNLALCEAKLAGRCGLDLETTSLSPPLREGEVDPTGSP
ncbi:MAG: hypothetical protein J5I35_11855 [Methanothrix harundinacea]|nr:hypothetical protein [Methanothrix harundinacea]